MSLHADSLSPVLLAQYDYWAHRRSLWIALANDKKRMRRLGCLQSTLERIEAKATRANNQVGRIIRLSKNRHASQASHFRNTTTGIYE